MVDLEPATVSSGGTSAHAAAPVLVAEHVRVGYRGVERLHDVSLALGSGLHVLLGPNGAGKTTLFRTLTGVLPVSSGTVRVLGRDPHADPEAKARIAMAGHRAALAPRMSVADNVEYWGRVLALRGARLQQRVATVLDEVGLHDIGDRRAATLSRGQQQRVALAKALLGEPEVLLLDEPLSGVDPEAAARLRAHLRDLAGRGRTVVISSHELAELADLGDDVIVLRDGAVIAHDRVSRLRDALLGSGRRMRLRGTPGLGEALSAAGYRPQPGREDSVEIEVPDDAAVRDLVARLVHDGVGLYEISPADNLLSDIYLSLASGPGAERADPPPGPGSDAGRS